MKKLLVLLCLLLLAGCSKGANVENPMIAKESLDEVNEITHGHLRQPPVMGVTQEGFYVIETKEGNIGEYDFVLNDIGYTVRFSDTIVKEDISGVWIDGKPAFSDDIVMDVSTKGAGYRLFRWFTTDGQYCLIAPDTINEELFTAVCSEMQLVSVAAN